MKKLIQHLLSTGQCVQRHGFIARPEEGAEDFIAVTVTSRADAQCTVFRTKNRQHAYFFHYLPNFVETAIKANFPNHVLQRATYYELFTLETEENDDIEDNEAHF